MGIDFGALSQPSSILRYMFSYLRVMNLLIHCSLTTLLNVTCNHYHINRPLKKTTLDKCQNRPTNIRNILVILSLKIIYTTIY